MDRAETGGSGGAPKLPYHAPTIARLGSVSEITAGGSGAIDPSDSSTGYASSSPGHS